MSSKKPIIILIIVSLLILIISAIILLFLSGRGDMYPKLQNRNPKRQQLVTSKKKYLGKKNVRNHLKISRKRKKNLLDRILSKLNLTKIQKIQIQQIRDSKPDDQERQEQIKKYRKKLNQAFARTQDQEEIRTLYRQIEALKSQTDSDDFEYLLKIRGILTPEQRRKFQKLRKKYKKKSL